VTPLTDGVIKKNAVTFSPLSDISRGSGGIFSDGIIANCLQILTMKQFLKSVNV